MLAPPHRLSRILGNVYRVLGVFSDTGERNEVANERKFKVRCASATNVDVLFAVNLQLQVGFVATVKNVLVWQSAHHDVDWLIFYRGNPYYCQGTIVSVVHGNLILKIVAKTLELEAFIEVMRAKQPVLFRSGSAYEFRRNYVTTQLRGEAYSQGRQLVDCMESTHRLPAGSQYTAGSERN